MACPRKNKRYRLGELERLEGIAVRKRTLDDLNINAIAKIAAEKRNKLLGGTANALGLSHVNVSVGRNKIRVGARLACTRTLTRGHDNVNKSKTRNVNKRIGIVKSVCKLNLTCPILCGKRGNVVTRVGGRKFVGHFRFPSKSFYLVAQVAYFMNVSTGMV